MQNVTTIFSSATNKNLLFGPGLGPSEVLVLVSVPQSLNFWSSPGSRNRNWSRTFLVSIRFKQLEDDLIRIELKLVLL